VRRHPSKSVLSFVASLARDPGRLRSALGKLATVWRTGGLAAVWHRLRQKLHLGRVGYSTWVKAFDRLRRADRSAISRRIETLRRPLISVLMPVHPTSEPGLRRTIDSLLQQLYPNWELCLTVDASTASPLLGVLEEYAARDVRVRIAVSRSGSHWSEARNAALELVRGELLALLDPGDELASHALYLVAEELNAHPDADVVYSDEDRVDEAGNRLDPFFKPDWSPDLLTSQNYVSRLAAYRTELVRRAGGFREETRESADYDLCLRCVAGTSPERIVHLPHVLYHRHAIEGSSPGMLGAKDEMQEAGRRALQDFVSRREPLASVELGLQPATYRIRRPLPAKPPLVTLIIPTRDGCALLRQCLDSIRAKTTYPNYEILIIDNQSRDPETLRYFDDLRRSGQAAIVAYDHPFNYSAINNFAVTHARGELIALLNNDIEVIGPDWLSEMVAQALRPEVGAVGAKLHYPDGSLQHAGVIVGLGGVADHGHRYLPREEPGYFGRAQVVHNLSAVTAACLVVRRDVYLQVGGLDDEHLAVAFNDVDFCLRLRDAGYLNVWTPYAELIHHESVSRGAEDTPEKQAREASEIEFMTRRWGARLSRDPYYSPNLSLDSENFDLAWPPRGPKPWRSDGPAEERRP
jgi:GT2 family glycosyltransferase